MGLLAVDGCGIAELLGAAAGPLRRVPISILKPLAGAEGELETNLRGFFEQDYDKFEILCAVSPLRRPGARGRRKAPPGISRGRVPRLDYRRPALSQRQGLQSGQDDQAARHGLLVMSDSDIRVGREMLRVVAAEFEDEKIDLLTCPYRAVPGRSFWSRLEAIGLNTEFLRRTADGAIGRGRAVRGGSTIVARKKLIEDLGGFNRFSPYLAEDFVLGKLAAEQGYGWSCPVTGVDHHIAGRIGSGASGTPRRREWLENLKHRLRWARSTRRSRPWGYLGQAFTVSSPVGAIRSGGDALAGRSCWPSRWRCAAAVWATAEWGLGRSADTRKPLAGVAAGRVGVAGLDRRFFGSRIQWRDRTYRLLADGRFELIDK